MADPTLMQLALDTAQAPTPGTLSALTDRLKDAAPADAVEALLALAARLLRPGDRVVMTAEGVRQGLDGPRRLTRGDVVGYGRQPGTVRVLRGGTRKPVTCSALFWRLVEPAPRARNAAARPIGDN